MNKLLDGTYPTNPIWEHTPFLIMFFELVVIALEVSLVIGNWEWVVKNKKNATIMIVVANLATFGLGTLIQLFLQGNFR